MQTRCWLEVYTYMHIIALLELTAIHITAPLKLMTMCIIAVLASDLALA